jgi:glutamyl-tRNA synthetase
MSKKVKVRFAPSPTGALHVGGIRTALFNYLFAKKHGGEFLLRIEDTDQTRFVEGAEKYIVDCLAWCGISPDNSLNPDGTVKYKQSEREYLSYAQVLVKTGHAYYAFDSSEELTAMRDRCIAEGRNNTGYNFITRTWMKNSFTLSVDEVDALLKSGVPYVIRFNMPKDVAITVNDIVKGTAIFDSSQLDDKILFKSDGLPTYHLANVVDDHLMEITHVIRADEWFPSTPLHIMLYKAFGWDAPEFCHLPLVLGPDGKKISKRKLAKYGFPILPFAWDYTDEKGNLAHAQGFREEGYEPDAIINFLSLLGWNPGGTEEIMTKEKLISLFDLSQVNSSGAIFDIEKLKSFNAHYMRNRDSIELFNDYIHPHIPVNNVGSVSKENCLKIVDIAKNRSIFACDLYKAVSYFFEPVILPGDVKLKNEVEFRTIMDKFLDLPAFSWNADTIKEKMDALCADSGVKIGKVSPDLRLALTGGIPGPELPLTMEVLGVAESIFRIQNLLDKTVKVAG